MYLMNSIQVLKMNYLVKVICFLTLPVFMRCSGPKYDTKYYQAVSENKQDTALLKLLISEEAFYGAYQIKYGGSTMDSGSVSGHVKGDTLIGKFNYLSRDNVKSTKPIALLQKNDKLQLGTGKVGTYLGLSVYQNLE
jgi:hypothetical protein